MKKDFVFRAFSLMELTVTFIIVAIVTTSTVPVFFKKKSLFNIKVLNKISTNCSIFAQANGVNNCKLCKKNSK